MFDFKPLRVRPTIPKLVLSPKLYQNCIKTPEVRNNGTANLKVDETPVVTAASVSHRSANKPVQLTPGKAATITTGAPLPLIADHASASLLAPGQSSRGVIGVHIPPGSTPLAVRVSMPLSPAPLQAMVVIP